MKSIKSLHPKNPDTKYMGVEPTWPTQPEGDRGSHLSRAFNWYSYFYGRKEAKEMIVDYFEQRKDAVMAKRFRSLSDSNISLTPAWLCRMATMGLILTEHEQQRLDSMLAEMLDRKATPDKEQDKPTNVNKPNIQDRLRERAHECAGELEGVYDDFLRSGAKFSADYKPIAVLRSMNISPQMINTVLEHWSSRANELAEVMAGKDSDLVEGYSNFSKIQLRNMARFCEAVINDCGAYVQIKKVERKPRKAKPVSPEKLASRFKLMRQFDELKLTGLPATGLIDKSEAYLYDTKKRKLIHVVADGHVGSFTLKGNNIIGISTAETLQKTLRRPAEQIKALLSGGKPAARKYFKDIKAVEIKFNGRGNENLIILKSW